MWGPYVGLLPLSSFLLPPAAAARRPLVCASLHGPSSRPAMASELEQEAGRASPPQIRSRPAGAAPERAPLATAGAGEGKDSRPRTQGRGRELRRARACLSSERRRHGPAPRRRGRGRELRGARAGAMATAPQLGAPPPWPHALLAREGEGAPRGARGRHGHGPEFGAPLPPPDLRGSGSRRHGPTPRRRGREWPSRWRDIEWTGGGAG
ncbi:hypothetical protein PVAP13_6NG086006 [Panicum virgatum]|uniref:Uncharacterized protein n=1 Tax=Panicum virgatum TaxID=38727 RepID=A0A8T0QVH1_PANVG|nr:hypothetical protein PVAP13_6NG086006 [Panicum virgatum]